MRFKVQHGSDHTVDGIELQILTVDLLLSNTTSKMPPQDSGVIVSFHHRYQ